LQSVAAISNLSKTNPALVMRSMTRDKSDGGMLSSGRLGWYVPLAESSA
jgi:hypothetical protein